LLRRGTPSDLRNAHLLADVFDYALHHELDDWLPSAPDESVGEHNGYEDGDLVLVNDQAPPRIGRAGDIRLAGFTAGADVCGATGFCLNLDGGTGGNNAIAIVALLAAYQQFGDPSYLSDAPIIGNRIVGNVTDTSGTGYGGYYLGYQDMGVQPKPLFKSKSTENNADIFMPSPLCPAP
jgi:hypothetical protein